MLSSPCTLTAIQWGTWSAICSYNPRNSLHPPELSCLRCSRSYLRGPIYKSSPPCSSPSAASLTQKARVLCEECYLLRTLPPDNPPVSSWYRMLHAPRPSALPTPSSNPLAAILFAPPAPSPLSRLQTTRSKVNDVAEATDSCLPTSFGNPRKRRRESIQSSSATRKK